jgi:putative spermidine/putrescine transport system substrate-binding protein/spermidine/putrescine transport system substrate-binding protein
MASRPLAMVVYEGWEDEEASRTVREGGVDVQPIYVDNDRDLIDAMRNGMGEIDLICIDNRFTRLGIEEGLLVPFDFGRLRNLGQLFDRFAELSTLFGDTWSVPYVWGTCPVSYNAHVLESPPQSLLEFALPGLRGQVVIRDEPYNQIVVFARALGYEDPLRLTHADLERVIEAVLHLKRQTEAPVLALLELYDALISGDRPLATGAGWEGVNLLARRRGADVRSYHPREGDHAWVDAWCLMRDAPNVEAAYTWVDHMTGAEAQRIVCDKLPCGTVNRHAAELVSPEVKELFPTDDLERLFGRPTDVGLPPLQPSGELATFADWRVAWERVRD